MENKIDIRDKIQKRKWRKQRAAKKLARLLNQKDQNEKAPVVTTQGDSLQANTTTVERQTLSVAIPGSILDNAQSLELRSYLAGQIARAAAIFCVQEIVVYDDSSGSKNSDCNAQLSMILEYLDCPQYLRKALFPRHPHLQYAGLMNPLDATHHLRREDESPYREGVTVDRPSKPGRGSLVNIGLYRDAQVDRKLRAGLRVTVRLLPPRGAPKRKRPADPSSSEETVTNGIPEEPNQLRAIDQKRVRGVVVSPDTPWRQDGIYWGYRVRMASSLSAALMQGPYSSSQTVPQCSHVRHYNGYDFVVGTSERGCDVDEFSGPPKSARHILIVFGGLQGLEYALDTDRTMTDVDNPSELFDAYVNTCPQQGSRTIRTEEALLVSLAALRHKLQQHTSHS